jgi:hypothetical protein
MAASFSSLARFILTSKEVLEYFDTIFRRIIQVLRERRPPLPLHRVTTTETLITQAT